MCVILQHHSCWLRTFRYFLFKCFLGVRSFACRLVPNPITHYTSWLVIAVSRPHTPPSPVLTREWTRARVRSTSNYGTADCGCVCVCVRGVVFVWPPHALAKDTHWMYLFEHYIVRVSGAVFLRSPLMCDAWLRSLLVGCTNCNVRFAEHIHQHTKKKHNTQSMSDSIDWRIYISILRVRSTDRRVGGTVVMHIFSTCNILCSSISPAQTQYASKDVCMYCNIV